MDFRLTNQLNKEKIVNFNIETNTACKLDCSEYSKWINPSMASVYALDKSIDSDKMYMSGLNTLHENIAGILQSAFDAGRRFETNNK